MKVSKGFNVAFAFLVLALLIALILPAIRTSPCGAPKTQAQHETQSLQSAMRAYLNEYSSMPTGTAAEIMSQLLGNNVRQIVFFEVSSSSLDSSGAFMDPWDTPYRISINGTNVETRSAGPDMKFGTKDDIAAP